jgi:hypothetical protein
MKTPIATMFMLSPLALAVLVQGQTTTPARRGNPPARTGVSSAPPARALQPVPDFSKSATSRTPATAGRTVKSDPKVVLSNNEAAPDLTPLDELEKPKIALPTAPLGPYLLQKEHGPFMVMAHTFRGPDASRYAQALCIELHERYKLPAYIWHVKIQPGRSNIRNVAPTAPAGTPGNRLTQPEGARVYDEAAVLVGNCATEQESQALWHKVKKLHCNTLDGLPSIYPWRKKGLSRALMTTNPLRASQELFPGSSLDGAMQGRAIDMEAFGLALQNAPKKPDKLLVDMNQGRYSLLKCQGEWVIQVAEFSGRSVIADGTAQSIGGTTLDGKKIDGKTLDKNAVQAAFHNKSFLERSPLAQAGIDAEHLAAGLSKSKKLGHLKPYVYHDRFSSKVYIGPFSSPNDPNVANLLKSHAVPGLADEHGLRLIDEINYEMLEAKRTVLPLIPANQLTRVPRP